MFDLSSLIAGKRVRYNGTTSTYYTYTYLPSSSTRRESKLAFPCCFHVPGKGFLGGALVALTAAAAASVEFSAVVENLRGADHQKWIKIKDQQTKNCLKQQ